MSSAAIDSTALSAPGPAKVPGSRFSLLRGWISDPLAFMERAREHGDVVIADIGSQAMWMVFKPEYVQHVLVNNAKNYNKNTRGYRAMRLTAGQGLVTSEGDLWKRQRRIANPAFHRKSIAAMADVMVECSADMAAKWRASAQAGDSRDVAHDMMELTLRIACRTFFSVDVEGGAVDRIGDASDGVLKQFLFHMSFPVSKPEYLPTLGNYRYWKAKKILDDEVYGMVAERRASGEAKHDLLSMFLGAVDDETGESMSDEQLRDELITMLIAGHETTANALAWCLHLLAENPDQLARMHAEMDEVLGDRLPTAADLPNLPLADRVLSESLRLFPPAYVHARCTVDDDIIGGHRIPKGAFVTLPQWVIHRDPAYWEEPLKFDPDRWLPERSEGREKFAYFPFSGGARKCIGDRFAKMESVLALVTLLRTVQLAPTPGKAPQTDPSITLRPKNGVWLDLSAR